MSIELINVGSGRLATDGECIRDAFIKINSNFEQLNTGTTTIQIRRDSAADWTSVNPTLSNGEFGYETDTDKLKIGNGTTAWNSLGYLIDGSSFTNIDLTDLSVGTPAAASGSGAIAYNNITGVFTYTPPDLSTYLTSVPAQTFASLTSKPTTLSGYGITDAQATLVSATNIKTINGTSLLGSGNIAIAGGGSGIALTDLSVGTPAAASGSGAIAYNNITGVFTYTPPDLSTYLTAETNDLTSAVTWANVPDANITQTSVTQHQAALSITESQISDLQSYLTTETSHADVLVDGDFATAGFMKSDGEGNYTVDNSTYLTSFTETNDLTAAVTWANVPDANITQTSVTQHQAALSITESQISDLGSYLTDLTGSSLGTLSDVNFNSVTLDDANGAGKVLAWDQTLQAFVPVDQSGGGGGLANVVEDTTPELGGNLDALGNNIVNVDTVRGETNSNIFVQSTGTGTLFLTGKVNMYDLYTFPNAGPTVRQFLVSDDDFANLAWSGAHGAEYTPTTSTDWTSPPPISIGAAIDRLATVVKALNSGTGA